MRVRRSLSELLVVGGFHALGLGRYPLGMVAHGDGLVKDGARRALEVEQRKVLAGAEIVDAPIEQRTVGVVAEKAGRLALELGDVRRCRRRNER